MKPETLERLKKAARSTAADEDAAALEAAEELEATAGTLAAFQTFSRESGIELDDLLDRPAETAAAFGRDGRAAASALPQLGPETVADRRRELTKEIARLGKDHGYAPAFTDALATLLAGTPERPNAAMFGRDDGADSFRGLAIVELLAKHGPPPPKGQFAAGREAPRQSPGDGTQTAAELREEGRKEGERIQQKHLAGIGAK